MVNFEQHQIYMSSTKLCFFCFSLGFFIDRKIAVCGKVAWETGERRTEMWRKICCSELLRFDPPLKTPRQTEHGDPNMARPATTLRTQRESCGILRKHRCHMGVPEMGVGSAPIAGWFIVEKPVKMDDLGVPPFQEMPICQGMSRNCNARMFTMQLWGKERQQGGTQPSGSGARQSDRWGEWCKTPVFHGFAIRTSQLLELLPWIIMDLVAILLQSCRSSLHLSPPVLFPRIEMLLW